MKTPIATLFIVVGVILCSVQPCHAQTDLTKRLTSLSHQFQRNEILELVDGIPVAQRNSAATYFRFEALVNLNRMNEAEAIVSEVQPHPAKDVYDHLVLSVWARKDGDFRTRHQHLMLALDSDSSITAVKLEHLRYLREKLDVLQNGLAQNELAAVALKYRDDNRVIEREWIMNFSGWPTPVRIVKLREFCHDHPNDGTAHKYLGHLLVTQNQGSEALPWLDRAVQLLPNQGNVLVVRADANAALKNHTAAVQDYTRAIELDPNGVSYHARGGYYLSIGNGELAGKDFIRAVKLDPNTKHIRDTAFRWLTATKNYNQAGNLVDVLIELEPTNPYNHYLKGQVYKFLGLFDQTIAAIDRAIKISPPEFKVDYRAHRAIAFSYFEKHEEALIQIAELYKQHPDHKMVQQFEKYISDQKTAADTAIQTAGK